MLFNTGDEGDATEELVVLDTNATVSFHQLLREMQYVLANIWDLEAFIQCVRVE